MCCKSAYLGFTYLNTLETTQKSLMRVTQISPKEGSAGSVLGVEMELAGKAIKSYLILWHHFNENHHTRYKIMVSISASDSR